MKLGCCIPGGSFMPEGVKEVRQDAYTILITADELIRNAGYDYSEAGVGMIVGLCESDMKRLEERYRMGKLGIEACNSFIPPNLMITGGRMQKELEAYAELAMSRLSRIGVGTVVFGSGEARRLSHAVSVEKGLAETAHFLAMCDRLGEKYDLKVVIEPLRRQETDQIHTVKEGAAWVRKLKLSHVGLLGDAFHMAEEGEAASVIEENADILGHMHFSVSPGRLPVMAEGSPYVIDFAGALKRAGYQGRVSMECGFTDFQKEIRESMIFCRKYF